MKRFTLILTALAFLAQACSTAVPTSVEPTLSIDQIAQLTMEAMNLPLAEGPPNPPPTDLPPSVTAPPPTATLPPTATNTAVPTATSTPNYTPTPDMRVFAGSTRDLLCQLEDMPGQDGDFTLNPGDWSQHTNQEVIEDHPDPEHGEEYIQATGRVDGWWVNYTLINLDLPLPDNVFCQVVQYKTVEGALEALHWGVWDYMDGFHYVDAEDFVGQDSILLFHEYRNQEDVVYRRYIVQFVYQNLMGTVQPNTPARIADANDAIDIAEKLLERLKAAPLSDQTSLEE